MRIYKIAWKHVQPGTYACTKCACELKPVDVIKNNKHHFSWGQLYKCSCGKSNLWTNSIRYPSSLIEYANGGKNFPHTEDPEAWGFCNDQFCPICWGAVLCLKNGYKFNGEWTDLYGCRKCDNNFVLTSVGKLGEVEGQVATAQWYKKNKGLWISKGIIS